MPVPEIDQKKPTRVWIWLICLAGFCALLPVFYQASHEKGRKFNSGFYVHPEFGREPVVRLHDQKVYLNFARKLKESDYQAFIPRHRTPGYPMLQSLFYRDDLAPPPGRLVSDEFFALAKRVNIVLSMLLLVGVFAFASIWIGPLWSLLFTLAGGYYVFIFKSCYTQPELLYYALSFMAFVLLGRMLVRPGWFLALSAGGILAAAHFVKSSTLPLLALFLACYGVKLLCGLIWKPGVVPGEGGETESKRVPLFLVQFLRGALVPVVFLGLLSPYLLETWRNYGSPFFSVHSTYYLWIDTKEELREIRASGASDPDYVAPEDGPSLKRYLATHTLEEITQRPVDGIGRTKRRLRAHYRQANYFIVILLRMALVVFVLKFPLVISVLRRNWIPVLYVAGFLTGYAILYGWYDKLNLGPRLMLSLYLPLIYVLIGFLRRCAEPFRIPRTSISVNLRNILWVVLAAYVAFGIHDVLTLPADNPASLYFRDTGG